jgi:hypothetical protein
MHLKEECLGHTICPDCNGSYKKGKLIQDKDYEHSCVEFLTRLIRQITGNDAYERAWTNLIPKSYQDE